MFSLRGAMAMERAAERRRTRRLVLGPVDEVGALGSFKRPSFGVRTFNGMARAWGGTAMPRVKIIRPVGLGFCVLQHVSCRTDAWRREVPAGRDFIACAPYKAIVRESIASLHPALLRDGA